MARRRPAYRRRRRTTAEPARGTAVRGSHARLRVPVRGGGPASPRGRRAPACRRQELGRGIALILDRQFQDMPQERLTEALRLHLETYRREAPLMRVIEQMSRYDPEVRAFRRARHEEYANLMAEAIRQLQRRGLADP